jgi:TonB family protein
MGFESKGRSGVSNVSHTTLSAKTPGAAGSTVAERARAKRAADPVCIEMPVRVRGIGGLPIAGSSDMGQDFSEDTRTLIVMATGAVVRMATRVKKGQLLGLKHLSTGQEVSCRVVNVRSSGTPEDYAEVEFTQRAVGFWGIHFPNDPKDQPPTEEAPSPGEVEAERVIFGGGHTERGNVNVAPSTAGAAAQDAKAGGKADPKAENAPFADLVKPEPSKAAPVDSPGFSGLSKSAEEGAASAERVLRDDAVIQQQQAQRNVISFPSPTTHQEKANILAGPEEKTLGAKLDFSPVIEEPAAKQAPSDAEIEHAAIARAIEEKAAREKTEAAARERAEAERKAAEVRAAKAAADKAAAERLAAAHAEFERIETEKRAEAERKAAEVKAAKAAAEKAAAEKAATERLAAAQLELERKEAERRAAERMAAAERTRLFGEAQKKQEAQRIAAERIAAEIAARDQATDDVEVAPSPEERRRDAHAERKAAPSETRRRSAAARPRRSLRMSIGATAHGTLEEEIQRDRAALKTTKTARAFVIGGAAAAVVVLAVAGWWYMRGGAREETPQTSAPTTSLPSRGRTSTPASSAAIAPASAPSNAAATNSADPSASGANGTIAPGAAPVKPAAASPLSSANTVAAQPSGDSKKPDSKKTANAKDNAALKAAAASELAKSAPPIADKSADVPSKPAEAPSKPVLKATLSAPVAVKRNSAAGDVAAPDIEAPPVSGADALPLGAVASSSVAPATPRVGGHAVPPRLLKPALPEYPVLARQRHIEGDVVVQADIDVSGNVKSVKVISGSELLRDAALNAVRQFKYTPAQLDGSPTTSQVLVTVKFRSK